METIDKTVMFRITENEYRKDREWGLTDDEVLKPGTYQVRRSRFVTKSTKRNLFAKKLKLSLFGAVLFALAIVGGAVLVKTRRNSEGAAKSQLNRIDGIKTAEDIEKLLRSIDRRQFEGFKVGVGWGFNEPYCKNLKDAAVTNLWTKADFDKNGLTDLVVIGHKLSPTIVVIVADRNDRYSVRRLSYDSFMNECSVATVRNAGADTLIDYTSIGEYSSQTSTLVYSYGDFVEYRPSPQQHQIERVDYDASGCYGTCPSFTLTINADRTASYDAGSFNKRQSGYYFGTIDVASYYNLIGLLNQIDFTELNDDYSIPATDNPTAVLTITYDGGKVKKISDCGMIGTASLHAIYERMEALSNNQIWY